MKEEVKNTIKPEENSSNDTKGKVGKKTGLVILCILAVIALAVGLLSCNKMSDTEIDYALIQNTKTLDYSKEGEKVNPIELVTIYRVTDENNQKESSSEKKQTDAGLVITCKPTSIDTSKTGETEVEFTVKDKEHKDVTKTLSASFKVVDNSKSTTSDTAPIKLSDKKQEITVGDKFDVKTVVSEAGDYKLVDKAPEKNEDGTYDTAWYTLSSNVDTSKAGTYEVTIHYVDKDGKATDKKVTVTVKEASSSDKKNDSLEKASNGADSASSASKSTSSGTNTQPTQNSAPAASKQPSGTSSANNSSSGTNNSAANPAGTNNGGGTATCTKKHVQTKAAWSEQVLVSAAYDETVVDQEAYDEQVYQGTTTVCNGCGQEFSSYDEWWQHAGSFAREGDWSHGGYHSYDTYTTVHHDAVTHVVHHDAVYTTVDHPAEYTEVCN